ncbi:MAG: sensor histidine kinase [Bacteroidota bacterium]
MNAHLLVDQFIKSCSHDLRAPLSSIKGLVNVAKLNQQDPETERCLDLITDCANKMDAVLHSLQEFLEVNKQELKPESTDCHTLIDQVLESHIEEAASKEITIQKNIRVPNPWKVDRYTFTRMVKILVENAIRFQDPFKTEKFVSVEVKGMKNVLVLEIKDNGVGIPMHERERIFHPFVKASTDSKGIGMGLFLLNKLVEKTKAKLVFASVEGIGSTFRVVIPHN